MDDASLSSLQDRFAPRSHCFGCGPAHPSGLRIKSYVEGDEVVATWTAAREHEAFDGIVNGGILGALLDCHGNWTAAAHVMREDGLDRPPVMVTAEFTVKLRRPTPSGQPLMLRTHAVERAGRRVAVEGTLEAQDQVTVRFHGVFVVVTPEHPAHDAWA